MSAVNRNDPCPCGSGRKAKNCCLRPEVPKGRRPVVDFPAMDGRPAQQFTLADATAIAQRFHMAGDLRTAGELFRLILESDPEFDQARFYYGVLLHQTGRSDEGLELMKLTAARHPEVFHYHDNLAKVHDERRQMPEALAAFRQAHKLRPSGESFYNIGVALMNLNQLEEAAESFRKSIALQPRHKSTTALTNLGSVLHRQGKLHDAIECFKMALEVSPEESLIHSNYLYVLNFLARPNLAEIFEEHRKIGAGYEKRAPRSSPIASSAMPPDASLTPPVRSGSDAGRELGMARKIRVGYLSPDFRQHSVAHFIEPVLAAHDRSKFELFAYYHHTLVDDVTRRLQALVPNWRPIHDKSDEEVARMVRDDRIDILVDLAGHSGLNRLPVFARKPAPVQVTWLGYPNTTGLNAMDYRITDAFADPPGMTEAFHTEKLVRLPDCFSCFKAPAQSPDVGPLPALRNGHITFGSFNMLSKMTPEVLATWSRLLKRVPTATLLLKYQGLDSDAMRTLIRSIFKEHGVDPKRVAILGLDASHAAHMERYNSVDIGLDPFPYNGTTTTCDALWMGVPVVTLAGVSHVGRVGVSQLSNLGLSELIAKDEEDYIRIAADLAGNLKKLESLRAGLRARMQASPLMDVTRFTRHLEVAYQTMVREHQEALPR
ncbi:MAG: tetratricopeptide repeat protein [Planctomycetes bacterium]|nr:tetratricopeptide repeat protein [Planctomycetota bacterium]